MVKISLNCSSIPFVLIQMGSSLDRWEINSPIFGGPLGPQLWLPPINKMLKSNPKAFLAAAVIFLLSRIFLMHSSISSLRVFLRAMAASHPEKFKASSEDEDVLLALVEKHLLPNRVALQWRSAKGKTFPP
jgi:hypothetical protein